LLKLIHFAAILLMDGIADSKQDFPLAALAIDPGELLQVIDGPGLDHSAVIVPAGAFGKTP
jgi:hypothetical protein